MRVLFLSTNRFRIEMALPMPIGLACIIAQIDEHKHAIEVLDMMFSDDPSSDLRRTICEFEPDLVAVSIRNLDNMSYLGAEYFLPEAKELIDLCRSQCDATIVIGGPAFSTVPAHVFDYLEPDFGIVGDGEVSFSRLVECIENDLDWTDLPGLVWRSEAGLRLNPSAAIDDWSGLRFPRRDLFDTRKYAQAGGFSNIVISQGCPMRCLYCDDPHRLGTRRRTKAPQIVADELEVMSKELGDVPIFFTAPIFNNPVRHAKEVCRAIIARDLKTRWTALIHPGFVDEELVELMRAAGCFAVSPASDSCSERMLKVLRKDLTTEQLERATELLERFGIGYLFTILFGGPGEDRESIEETLSFLKDKKPLVATFAVGIRILPNTALAGLAVDEGLISADDPLMEPKFYLSPKVKGWVEEYLTKQCSQHENWMFTHDFLQTRSEAY